ncbi:MAG: KTSC domain-containing protein [Chthoniobacterales bacterium]|nr:KTSC domain-containing protein [Chthoniobacterales bacterium]
MEPILSRIPHEAVASRALASVGYSKRLHALEIEFHRGGTYRYFEVPPVVHTQLLRAESKARYYNSRIRGKYRAIRVRSPRSVAPAR